MRAMKEKGRSSQVNRKAIQRKSSDCIDHWAFLEEIEAPMWADLTLEAQFMDKDIDDSWFRVSHPVHQLSSRQLKKSFQHFGKDKDSSHNFRCHSPKVPDSVSRSRGKHYKSRKWSGNVPGSLTAKQHPVREFVGKNLGTVIEKDNCRNSSMSTITISSSSRKPLQSFVDDVQNSILKSTTIAAKSSSNSAISKCQILRAKSSFGIPRNTSGANRGTSQVTCKTSSTARISSLGSSRNTRYSVREITKSGNLLQNRNSSAGKSSVGSSCSLGSILENVNSTKMLKNVRTGVNSAKMLKNERTNVNSTKILKNERTNVNSTKMLKNERTKESKKASGSVLKVHEARIKGITQCSKHQNRAGGAKFISQESKSKVLHPVTTRKPLCQISESKLQKNGSVMKPRLIAGAAKKKLVSVRNKENNTIEGELQCPRSTK